MTQQEFWDLIGLIDWDRLEDAEEDAAVRPLIEALVMKPPEEITAFDDLLAEKVHALDGPAWAEAASVAGQYEDLFLYARLCVVANGEDVWTAVRDDPSLMPEAQFEELLFAAEKAWKVVTGRDYEHEPAFSMEMRSNSANWTAAGG